jgi:hypothetical protein
MLRFRALKTSLAALGLIGAVETAAAQPVAIGVERIDSERPEAWAMQYFTGITSVGGFTVPERRQAGAISFGGELVWIPVMSEARRRVGFNGTKLEDLNKAPFFVRPRATVALPGALAVTIAWVPPVETFGVRPNLLAMALERPMYESTAWSVGWRAHGQTGTARAAFTCPQDAVRFPPGTLANPSGCLEPSSDTATLRYVALELSAGQSIARRTVAPHGAVAVNYFDNQFDVDARRFDVLDGVRQEFIDRTSQKSHATRVSLTGGVAFRLADRLQAVVDVFYMPLWVKRGANGARQNDSLVNARVLMMYRAR